MPRYAVRYVHDCESSANRCVKLEATSVLRAMQKRPGNFETSNISCSSVKWANATPNCDDIATHRAFVFLMYMLRLGQSMRALTRPVRLPSEE